MYQFQFSYWYLNSWLMVPRGRISQDVVKPYMPNPQQGFVSLWKSPPWGLSCILYHMRDKMFSKVQEMSLSEKKYFSMIALVSQSLELQESKLCYQSHSSWCDVARQYRGFSSFYAEAISVLSSFWFPWWRILWKITQPYSRKPRSRCPSWLSFW